MAILPTYDSSGKMTTQADAVPLDASMETAGARNVQKIGKAIGEVAALWQRSKDFTETLSAKTDADSKTALVLQSASEEPDYRNKQKYIDELDSINEVSDDAFSNNLNRMDFSNYTKGKVGIGTAKINSMFRNKEIVHGQAKGIEETRNNKQNYIATGNPQYKKDNLNLLEGLWENGIYDSVAKTKGELDMSGWDYDRAVYDATNGDAYEVVKRINEGYYELEQGKKGALITEIKGIAQIKNKEEDIELLKIQHETKQSYLEEEESRSLPENLQLLEEGTDLRTMNKDWAEQKRAALLSAKSIGATTQNAYFAEVTDKINEAQAAYEFYEDDKSADEYFKALQDAEIAVQVGRKNGLLDKASEKVLNGRIYTKIGAKARHDVSNSLDRAIKYFRTEMPNKEDADAAIREYLYRVSDQDVENLDSDKILGAIKSNYLKSKDPTYNEERYQNVDKVRLINIGDVVINPLTLEQKVLDKNGQWVSIL